MVNSTMDLVAYNISRVRYWASLAVWGLSSRACCNTCDDDADGHRNGYTKRTIEWMDAGWLNSSSLEVTRGLAMVGRKLIRGTRRPPLVTCTYCCSLLDMSKLYSPFSCYHLVLMSVLFILRRVSSGGPSSKRSSTDHAQRINSAASYG